MHTRLLLYRIISIIIEIVQKEMCGPALENNSICIQCRNVFDQRELESYIEHLCRESSERTQKNVEAKAQTAFREITKTNMSLEQAIDHIFKGNTEILEKAHTLRLCFETDKQTFLSNIQNNSTYTSAYASDCQETHGSNEAALAAKDLCDEFEYCYEPVTSTCTNIVSQRPLSTREDTGTMFLKEVTSNKDISSDYPRKRQKPYIFPKHATNT
jgi:hypothetical protein